MSDSLPVPQTNPEHRAPDGPRWVRGVYAGDEQIDGRGARWIVVRMSPGGRTIHWKCYDADVTRTATTEAAPTHPHYPTDAEVLAADREERRRAKNDPDLFA